MTKHTLLICSCLLIGSIIDAMAQDDKDEPVSSYDGSQPAEAALSEGVTGRIMTSDGRPIVGAMIVPRSLEAEAPAIPEIAITSGTDGTYEWQLPPGRYEISVIAEGYENGVERITLGAENVLTVNFSLRNE